MSADTINRARQLKREYPYVTSRTAIHWARREEETRATLEGLGLGNRANYSDDDGVTVELAAEGYTLHVEWMDDDFPYELGDAEEEYPEEVCVCVARVFDPAGNEVGFDALHGIGLSDWWRDAYVEEVTADVVTEACEMAHVAPYRAEEE